MKKRRPSNLRQVLLACGFVCISAVFMSCASHGTTAPSSRLSLSAVIDSVSQSTKAITTETKAANVPETVDEHVHEDEPEVPEVLEPMPVVSLFDQFADLSPDQVVDYLDNYAFIKRVVIREAGNQGFEGMCAVAQVIHDRVVDTNYDWGDGFYGVLTEHGQFAAPYPDDISAFEPTISEVMSAVFMHGKYIFDAPTFYFYNPACSSASGIAWMQTLQYVGTIGDHEFRTEWYVDLTGNER